MYSTARMHANVSPLDGVRPPVHQDGGQRRMALALEFMEGGTLHEFLGLAVGSLPPSSGGSGDKTSCVRSNRSRGGVTARSREDLVHMLRLAVEIASGLNFLHEFGVLHRDVKVRWRRARSA